MKLRNLFITILSICLLVGSPMAPSCQAATLIDFDDNNPTGGRIGALSDWQIWYASWSQTVSSNNTTISAIIDQNFGVTVPGHAWLMNQVGPGTTVTNLVAETDFNAPALSNANFVDLSTAPYATLFTGLSLTPGTYYLILQGPYYLGNGDTYQWFGDYSGITIAAVTGFTVGAYGFTNSPNLYIPSSTFNFPLPSDSYLFYRVEGVTTTPEPTTILLFGLGLVGLAGVRRKMGM
jgi:hypothetical protein